MSSASPTDLQWLLVSIVMCVDALDAAGVSFQLSSFQRSLHRQMGIIFCWFARRQSACLVSLSIIVLGSLSRASSLVTVVAWSSIPFKEKELHR